MKNSCFLLQNPNLFKGVRAIDLKHTYLQTKGNFYRGLSGQITVEYEKRLLAIVTLSLKLSPSIE